MHCRISSKDSKQLADLLNRDVILHY